MTLRSPRWRGVLCAFAVLCMAAALSVAPRARAETANEPVAAVFMTSADAQVLDEVERLGVMLTRRERVGPVSDAELLTLADEWPERIVLVVDEASSTVRVVRTHDRTTLVRILNPGVIAEEPYAVALAATELLGLSRELPLAVASQALSPPPPPAAQEHALSSTWLVSMGGELASSPRREPTLWRPLFTLGVELGARHRRPFGLLHLTAAPFGRLVRAAPESKTEDEVRYTRSDFGARLGGGARVLAGSVLGYVSGGVGLLSATARDASGAQLGSDRRMRAFAGAGGEFRYEPWSAFALVFGLEGVYLPGPVSYLVRGRTTIREGALRIGTSISLAFVLR